MTKPTKKSKADQKAGGVSYPYPELGDEDGESILWPVVASLVGHVAVLVALVFVPQPSFEKSYMPTVISVQMVSPGDIGSGPPAADTSVKEKPAPEPKSAPEPAKAEEVQSRPEVAAEPPRKVPTVEKKPVQPLVPEPEVAAEPPKKMPTVEKKPVQPPVQEPEVSLAQKEKEPEKPVKKPEVNEKPKVKESLKEKTYKESQIVKSAIERLERETAEQPRTNSVLDAIEKLRKDVEANPRKPPASSEKVASAGGTGTGGTGGTGAGAGRPGFGAGSPGGVLGGMFDVYKAEIAYHIQRNWAFSEQLAQGRKDLEVLVGIKIMPDGRIEDVWFDKKSGNQYLDDSAIRAVKKSNPLPPLPKTYRGSFLETGLRFTPAGLGLGR